MKRVLVKNMMAVGVIYLSALGIAQAQEMTDLGTKSQGSSLTCSDKAKDVARKAFGNCLADQKAQEINDLRKQYVKDLEEMRNRHQKEVAELRQERVQLRKGIINNRKIETSQVLAEPQSEAMPIVTPVETTVAQSVTSEVPTIELKKIETIKEPTQNVDVEVVESKDTFE